MWLMAPWANIIKVLHCISPCAGKGRAELQKGPAAGLNRPQEVIMWPGSSIVIACIPCEEMLVDCRH